MPDELTPVDSGGDAGGGAQEFTGELNLGESDDTSTEAVESPSVDESTPETDDSSTGQESQAEVAEVIPGQPAAQPFKFYGRDWDNEEAATQHFKSMDGRVRAQGQEIQEITGLVRRWNDWYNAEQDRKEAAAAEEKPKGEPYLDAIDWNSVNAIAEKSGTVAGIKAAILQLGDHLSNNVVPGLKSDIAVARQPAEEAEKVARANEFARDWFQNAANHVDPEGNPTFPQLHEATDGWSPEIAAQTVRNWGQLIRAYPKFGMTRDGVDLCLSKAIASVGAGTKTNQAAKAAAGAVARNAQGQFLKQSEATVGEEADGGTGATPGAANSGTPQSASEAAERKAIKNAGRGTDNETARFLGVM